MSKVSSVKLVHRPFMYRAIGLDGKVYEGWYVRLHPLGVDTENHYLINDSGRNENGFWHEIDPNTLEPLNKLEDVRRYSVHTKGLPRNPSVGDQVFGFDGNGVFHNLKFDGTSWVEKVEV